MFDINSYRVCVIYKTYIKYGCFSSHLDLIQELEHTYNIKIYEYIKCLINRDDVLIDLTHSNSVFNSITTIANMLYDIKLLKTIRIYTKNNQLHFNSIDECLDYLSLRL